jgi:predicted glutamine amidotransferase
MCGIVGYIAGDKTGFPNSQMHFLRYALILDTLRGPDSTGLIQVQKDFEVKAFRSTLGGHQFVEGKCFEEYAGVGWCGIGHNRAATRGNVNLDNAHPFRFGPVTMVHNGTLNHWGASLPTFQKDFAVDSMQIAYALSEAKPEEARDVLSMIDGSFAIVWTDERDESVNMARNNERPLHFTWNAPRNFMMFMSDGHMLTSINKSMRHSSAQGGSIYQIDSMKHLKWRFGSIEPEVQEFAPFVKPNPIGMAPAGRDLRSAVERAQDKWAGRPNQSSTTSGEFSVTNTHHLKVNIDGRLRTIPAGHTESLENFFGLKPTDYLEFTPESSFDMQKNTVYVGGQVRMLHWGDCPWEAVLMNVPRPTWDKYSDGRWTVRPIGLTRRMDSSVENLPSLLCQFVRATFDGGKVTQCDVDSTDSDQRVFDTLWGDPMCPFDEDQIMEKVDQQEEEDNDPDRMVIGPSGILMAAVELSQLLIDGCVGCGDYLHFERAGLYEMVNEGRDVLCNDCKWNREADCNDIY